MLCFAHSSELEQCAIARPTLSSKSTSPTTTAEGATQALTATCGSLFPKLIWLRCLRYHSSWMSMLVTAGATCSTCVANLRAPCCSIFMNAWTERAQEPEGSLQARHCSTRSARALAGSAFCFKQVWHQPFNLSARTTIVSHVRVTQHAQVMTGVHWFNDPGTDSLLGMGGPACRCLHNICCCI